MSAPQNANEAFDPPVTSGQHDRAQPESPETTPSSPPSSPPGTPTGIPPATPTPPYDIDDAGRLVRVVRDREGRPCDEPLANFCARIVRVVNTDDGQEVSKTFDVDVTVAGGRNYPVRGLPATDFQGLEWVIPETNGHGRIEPGSGKHDKTRDAIQYFSGDIPSVTRYGHLGWRHVDAGWVYLHFAGAIGERGVVPGVTVSLPDKFSRFVLPDPVAAGAEAVRAAIRASLRMLTTAPARITAPLLCAVWRAPLGPADFSLHVVGPTGVGKTVIAALAQQHWGAGLDWQNCPASWTSSANANEGLRFTAKDTLLLLDDLSPGAASPRDIDRTFRGQGNGSGRDRMAADTTIRVTKLPRCSLISTGEDSPLVQSAAARVLVLETGPTDVDWQNVTSCQRDADRGLYALVTAAYVQWIAGRYTAVRDTHRLRVADLRASLFSDGGAGHRRAPGIVAELMFGAEQFLAFAREVGAIDDADLAGLSDTIVTGLIDGSAEQNAVQRDADPVTRFRDLLVGSLTAGLSHVSNEKGSHPRNPGAWGWRGDKPLGDHVGWVDDTGLYLDPTVTYRVLAKMVHESGEQPLLTQVTLWKRLNERGLLITGDGGRETLKVRRMFQGARRAVLHLAATVVLGDDDAVIPEQRRFGT